MGPDYPCKYGNIRALNGFSLPHQTFPSKYESAAMFKMIKYSAACLIAVLVGGFLLLGSDFSSMIKTSARSIQSSVKESVPVEFELNRAKEKINEILPDMQSQVRMIAEEEVAIARLEKEVQQDTQRLERQEKQLTDLRGQMRTQRVSFSVGRLKLDRQQLANHLQTRFDHFKQARLSLDSKQRLLEKRSQGLTAAVAVLEQMRIRQSELELKVEALAAQHRLIKASQIETGTLVDGSQLSQADRLLDQIETRLAVAQRVMDYQSEPFEAVAEKEAVSADVVLSEIDAYFSPPAASVPESRVASAITVDVAEVE